MEITIGFPVYNVENSVRKSLLSALEQDFGLEYEILVVDDRGTDASMDIVHELAASHPRRNRVRIITNERNLGIGEARNIVIGNALGKYLYFLDSDDTIEPDCLSSLYELAERHSAEIVVGNDVEISLSGKSRVACKMDREVFLSGPGAGMELSMKYGYIRNTAWNRLISVGFLRSNGIRCLTRIQEDVILDFDTRLRTTRIAYCPKVVYNYILRGGSLISNCSDPAYESVRTNFRYIAGKASGADPAAAPRYFYQFSWHAACSSLEWIRKMGRNADGEDEVFRGLVAAIPSSTLFKSKSMDLVFKILKRRPEKATVRRFFRLKRFYRCFLGHFVAGTYAKLFTKKARRELYS